MWPVQPGAENVLSDARITTLMQDRERSYWAGRQPAGFDLVRLCGIEFRLAPGNFGDVIETWLGEGSHRK